MIVGILVLVPGLLASAGIGVESGPLSPWLGALDRSMQDIAFGSTLRFWLGVAGSTMMGLLLLYPLRKLFGLGSSISVAAWFHIHVVLGLFGPILIVYHCYFGTGSTPANVALFTTLAVALSGVFGHYVYTRLSADHHGERRRSQSHLQDALAELGLLDASPTKTKLIEDLQAFEAQSRSELRGRQLRERRRDLLSRAGWLVENQGPQQGWSTARCLDSRARIYAGLNGHFSSLGRAGRRSFYERLAANWRLLHLPLFYITVVATGVHVYKVWDMDAPDPAVLEASAASPGAAPEGDPGEGPPGNADGRVAASVATAPASRSTTADDSPRVPPIARRKAETRAEPTQGSGTAPVLVQAADKGSAEPLPKLVQEPRPASRSSAAAPRAATPDPAPSPGAASPGPVAEPGEWLSALPDGPPKTMPQTGTRAVSDAIGEYLAGGGDRPSVPPPASGATRPAVGQTPPRAPADPQSSRTAAAPPAQPAPPKPKVSPPVVAPAAPAAAPAPAEPQVRAAQAPRAAERAGAPPPPPQALGGPPPIKGDPVTELARKSGQLEATSGRLDPAALRQRLAELKKDRTFDHNKTRFPLTGKHTKVACEACHKTTLAGTPSKCIDCHRKDDVHRGRRPQCENCHVTTNWGTIIRRK